MTAWASPQLIQCPRLADPEVRELYNHQLAVRLQCHAGPEVEGRRHGGLAVDHGVLTVQDHLAGGGHRHQAERHPAAQLRQICK